MRTSREVSNLANQKFWLAPHQGPVSSEISDLLLLFS